MCCYSVPDGGSNQDSVYWKSRTVRHGLLLDIAVSQGCPEVPVHSTGPSVAPQDLDVIISVLQHSPFEALGEVELNLLF